MKLTKILMGIFGAIVLTGCSSEEIAPDQKPIEGEGQNRYMSITVRSVLPGTRAATNPGDQTDDGNYEIGYDSENNIKTLRFYFFDDKGAPVVMNGNNSYYECTSGDFKNDGTPDMDQTIEKVLDAVIVINSSDRDIATKIKKMAAIANYSSSTDLDQNLSVTDLKTKVGTAAVIIDNVSTNGFAMSSANYLPTGETAPSFTVDINPENVRTTRDEALAHPVEVYIERIAAKVRVKADWDNTVYTSGDIKTVTYDGQNYQAIPLYKKPAAGSTTKEPIKATVEGTEKQIYVIFTGWNLLWTADKSYLFKNIDGCDDTKLGGNWWNNSTFNRSFWAINPSGVTLQNHVHKYATKQILTSGSFATDSKTQLEDINKQNAYCLENAADDETSTWLKKTYVPSTQLTNRTLVYLGGMLVTIDGSNNASPLELAEWAANREPISNIKTKMFAVVQNQIYFRSKDGETTTESETTEEGTLITDHKKYKMIAVRVDDVDFVSAIDADKADDDSENSPRYQSFLNMGAFKEGDLKGENVAISNQLYKKTSTGFEPISIDDANDILEGVGGAKVYTDGAVYYYHDITHLNTTDNTGTKGQYGVVRNHIYEVLLNTVYGLGTPVLHPEDEEDSTDSEKIIPQKPSNEYFLGARMNILAWRVVKNTANFDW